MTNNISVPRVEFIAPNQAIIRVNSIWRFLQSYNSTIVFINTNGEIFLDLNYWDFSRTTWKYRNEFLWEDKKETESKIKSWEYTLIDLNN